MKFLCKVGFLTSALLFPMSVLAQTTYVENLTVSEVFIVTDQAFFRTVEPIQNPAGCSNTGWYALGRLNTGTTIVPFGAGVLSQSLEKFEIIQSALDANRPVNIVIRDVGCLGVFPAVAGVGSVVGSN